jgi:hypothetical protein
MRKHTTLIDALEAAIYSTTESALFWERHGKETAAAKAWSLVERDKARLKELQK